MTHGAHEAPLMSERLNIMRQVSIDKWLNEKVVWTSWGKRAVFRTDRVGDFEVTTECFRHIRTHSSGQHKGISYKVWTVFMRVYLNGELVLTLSDESRSSKKYICLVLWEKILDFTEAQEAMKPPALPEENNPATLSLQEESAIEEGWIYIGGHQFKKTIRTQGYVVVFYSATIGSKWKVTIDVSVMGEAEYFEVVTERGNFRKIARDMLLKFKAGYNG